MRGCCCLMCCDDISWHLDVYKQHDICTQQQSENEMLGSYLVSSNIWVYIQFHFESIGTAQPVIFFSVQLRLLGLRSKDNETTDQISSFWSLCVLYNFHLKPTHFLTHHKYWKMWLTGSTHTITANNNNHLRFTASITHNQYNSLKCFHKERIHWCTNRSHRVCLHTDKDARNKKAEVTIRVTHCNMQSPSVLCFFSCSNKKEKRERHRNPCTSEVEFYFWLTLNICDK